MDLHTPLKALGLTEKEVSTYLSLLPLGSVSLQELFKRLSYPRTTVYNTLTCLQAKGLVTTRIEKKVTHYSAVDPKTFHSQLNQKKELLNSIFPQLELLKKQARDDSSVQLFTGHAGVYAILSDVFSKKQQTFYFGSYSKSLEILAHLPRHARTMRLERNIPADIVIEHSNEEIFTSSKYKKLTRMRILPSLKSFPAMIFIYGNKIALFTLDKDVVGVIISNEQVAMAMKMVFDTYWSTAKEVKQ